MALTGKYNFPGIKKAGAAIIKAALATTSFGAYLYAPVIGAITNLAIELGINWLANRGLVILNIGAIVVDGKFDQKNFDDAMEKGLAAAEIGNLTEEQKKAIDDKVIQAFDKFVIIVK